MGESRYVFKANRPRLRSLQIRRPLDVLWQVDLRRYEWEPAPSQTSIRSGSRQAVVVVVSSVRSRRGSYELLIGAAVAAGRPRSAPCPRPQRCTRHYHLRSGERDREDIDARTLVCLWT